MEVFFFSSLKKKKKTIREGHYFSTHCIGQPFENRNGPTLAGFEMVAGGTREQGQGLSVALWLWGEEGRPLGARGDVWVETPCTLFIACLILEGALVP